MATSHKLASNSTMHPLSLNGRAGNHRRLRGLLLLLSLAPDASSFRTPMPPRARRAPASSLPAARSSGGASPPARASAAGTTQFVTNPRCPFAQKAWIALEASGCPYERREVSLYGPGGKPAWFRELNPRGTVPVVAVRGGGEEDRVFADSELILDALGEGRVPGGGEALSMSELSDGENDRVAEWRAAVSERVVPVGRTAVLGGALPPLRSLLRDLDAMVAGPYLAGERVTLADCAAFPFLWRIDREFGIGTGGGAAAEGEAKLRAWLDTCLRTPAIKKTVPGAGWWWWW